MTPVPGPMIRSSGMLFTMDGSLHISIHTTVSHYTDATGTIFSTLSKR